MKPNFTLKDFKIDQDIAELFEDLRAWTYNETKKDIRENGFHYPIIVAEDGTIVCGHQRYKIALELGIDPPYVVQSFKDKKAMIDYAIKDNLISSRGTLTNNMQSLDEEVLIQRRVEPSKPIKSFYSLTEKGEQIAEHLSEIKKIL